MRSGSGGDCRAPAGVAPGSSLYSPPLLSPPLKLQNCWRCSSRGDGGGEEKTAEKQPSEAMPPPLSSSPTGGARAAEMEVATKKTAEKHPSEAMPPPPSSSPTGVKRSDGIISDGHVATALHQHSPYPHAPMIQELHELYG